MKKYILFIILIAILSCKKDKSTSELSENIMEYIQSGKYEKALNINEKLIKLNQNSHYYLTQRGLILELLGKENDAQNYYSKARKLFLEKEEYYWTKYDSVNMAFMLIEIGDSIRGRELIKRVIKSGTDYGFSEMELRKILNQSHGDILQLIKSEK